MNERLSVADPSRAAKQSNSSSCRAVIVKRNLLFKDDTIVLDIWGPSPVLSWLELIPQWGISFDFLVAVLNSFLDTPVFLVSCKKNQKTMQPRNITCFRGETMSCLSPGCHFPVKWCYTAPWCRLPGPSSVFKHCIKMQERFRKHDTCYPSTSNLRLLDFQMYCKMQRCVAVVKKINKISLLCILMIKPTSWELNQIKMKCRVL